MAENRRFKNVLLVLVVILVIVVDAMHDWFIAHSAVSILVHVTVVVVAAAHAMLAIALLLRMATGMIVVGQFATEQGFGVLVETANPIAHSVADAGKE